jgi:hypothetical protein
MYASKYIFFEIYKLRNLGEKRYGRKREREKEKFTYPPTHKSVRLLDS